MDERLGFVSGLAAAMLLSACSHTAATTEHVPLDFEREPPTFPSPWILPLQTALADFRTVYPDNWSCFSVVLENEKDVITEKDELLVSFVNASPEIHSGDEITHLVGDSGLCGGPGMSYAFDMEGNLLRRSFEH
jgi:hypothetical protein